MAVIQTSNDALITKVYSSELGYFKDDYSKHFLQKKKKMLPMINRGTWARVFGIRQVVLKFIRAYVEKGEFNIISLGAGYDITYFWLTSGLTKDSYEKVDSQELRQRLHYVEIDFEDVVTKKI